MNLKPATRQDLHIDPLPGLNAQMLKQVLAQGELTFARDG